MEFENQKEIYEALLAGKKVCQNNWDKDQYVYIDELGFIMNQNNKLVSYTFNEPGLWKIWKEQKKKIKRWLWTYRDLSESGWLIDNMYLSELEAKNMLEKYDDYMKLPWSEMEFEE
jgi:hypothetical protein